MAKRKTEPEGFLGGGKLLVKATTADLAKAITKAAKPTPIEKIAATTTRRVNRAAGGLVEAAVEQAVPRRAQATATPKKTFPDVKKPSAEQEMYATQAANISTQLPALVQTMNKRQDVADALREQINEIVKKNGQRDKAGKMTLEPDAYKRAQALIEKFNVARTRAIEAFNKFDDVRNRYYELDAAYKENKATPFWEPPEPEPFTSAPGLFPTGPDRNIFGPAQATLGGSRRPPTPLRLAPGEKSGDAVSRFIGGASRRAAGVALSPFPFDESGLGKPELMERIEGLGKTGLVGVTEGGRWTAQRIKQQLEHDRKRGDYTQKVIQLEGEKGRKLTFTEQERLGASMGVNPFEAVGLEPQHVKNFIAGIGGVAVGGYNDPVQVAKDIVKLGVDVTVGTGLLVAALSRPDLTWADRKAMLAEMPKGIVAEYTRHFGSELSMLEAFERAEEDPVLTALLYPTPLAAGTQTARVLALTRLGIGPGKMSLKDAVRLARDPEKQRQYTYTERAPKGSGVESVKTQVPAFYSSSVFFRNVFQRPYDVTSKVIDKIPGARRLPISMSQRATSEKRKSVARMKNQRVAEAHAALREVQAFLNEGLAAKVPGKRGKNEHFATTLAVLVMKPNGLTDDEMERAVIQNLKDMLADPERMDLPGDEVSPAEQKIINRIARYEKKEEAERAGKRGLATRRVYDDQRRMGESLRQINIERQDLVQEYNDLVENPGQLMDAALEDEVARYEGTIRALDSQARVMREQLDEISVAQPAIESPKRTQAREVLDGLVYFQDYPQAADDLMLAADAVARHWAKEKGRTPEEWWEAKDVRRADPDEIPLEAYAQTRTSREDRQAAQVRLAELERVHQRQLDKLRLALYGKTERREVNYRTQQNRRAAQQEAGVTRSGRRSGASTWKSRRRQTVVGEHRDRAEEWMDAEIAKLEESDPMRRAWEKRVAEMDELRAVAYPEPEVFFQKRERPTDVPDPDALDAKAKEVYDRYSHLGGSMPPGVSSAAGWAEKGHEAARLAQLGAEHKDWYRDSGLAIRERIGPNNWKEARQIAAAIAYLSRTDSVQSNVGHAMRAFLSYKETGDAGLAGRYPNVANAKLNDIFKNNAWGGYKTNSFFRNILEEYDPARFRRELGKSDENVELDLGEEEGEVTVDRWMVRAFGFEDDNVGQKGRYFAVREMTQHIAEQLGWTPKQVQAAIWVAVKAESEAAKSVTKVAERNIKGKAKHDERVAKAAETGRGGPRKDFEPESPLTAEDFLTASGIHVGTSLDRITHQLRVNAEAAPGSTYAGFPEYRTFSPLAQDEFSRHIAEGVYVYNRRLGLAFKPGDRGPGLFEPEGAPIETNPAFASNISIGSTMRAPTAKKYGLERVPDWQRAEFDAIVAGQGRGTRQNAMPWLRPMVPENARDRTGIFVAHANLSTDDMLALRTLRGRGQANWQIAISHGDGGVWFTLVKGAGMTQARFQKKVGTMIDRHFGPDTEAVGYAHEGGYVENDWKRGSADYETAISNSRRPGEIRAASDALADHYESARVRFTSHPDGPDGEARRLRANRLARDRRARAAELDADPTAGRVFSQVRRRDTLGATQLINSATGDRIIWLTEHADFSTVVHELLGHAAEEMKDLHPEEFAKVEQVIGRELDEWEVADHEKFATWFERYLFEGHAPTPEMVPAFDRAKQYMRVIYEPMRREIGPRIPKETRDLFDYYLGGWDSESATRIAVNMGGFGPGEGVASGARVAAQQELATLQKRNRTRRYNQSMEGLMDQLKKLKKESDARGGTKEEQEALTAQIVRLQAEIVLRADKRVQNLRSKITDMEKALTRDPNNRRFSGALESAKWLMEDRERILKEAFGDESFEEMFSNRRDLLANYLVQHGLIKPDFEAGTGTYFPMKLDEGFLMSLKLPMTPASNRMLGEVQKALAGTHHRNEMIRWQAGDWSADPAVLQLAHARASSYQFILEVREIMHEMGRKLTQDEQREPKRFLPSGGYVSNRKGTPLSPDMKAATRGMTNTTTVENIDNGLFGDNEALEGSLQRFFENSIVDLDDLPPGFDLGDPDLRFISKEAVRKIFRPVQLNLFGKPWDIASTAARFALIYANVPGYMITNLAGNAVFLLMQQGLASVPRAVYYGQMLANDAKFRAMVGGEGGMLPAYSAITRGRNFNQQVSESLNKLEHNWLAFESKVDEYPRMIAWMAEANKKGYWSKEKMMQLMRARDPNTKIGRDRIYVSERTNQHMIDFTYRVSDRERAILGRLFFIWPYIRGATAMPFWYGKNYPARTALIAQLALQQRIYQEQMLGPLPPGREDLYPYKVKGTMGNDRRAVVVGSRYYNPSGPVADEIRLGSDLVASAFGRVPDNLSTRLGSLLNVNIENITGVFQGRDAFGNDVSFRQQLLDPYGIADSLVPFLRYARAAFDDKYTPRAFREGEGNTTKERVYRAGARVLPQTVSVDWLNAGAMSRGEKTTSEKIELAVVANKKHFHRVEGAKEHYPNALAKQVAAQVIYDDRIAELERSEAAKAAFTPKLKDNGEWDFGYTADEYDQAIVAWEVMKQTVPELLAGAEIGPPTETLRQQQLPPHSEGGKKFAKVYVDLFKTFLKDDPGVDGFVYASFYDTMYEKLKSTDKFKKEIDAGVYKGFDAVTARERAARARAALING